MLKFLARQVPAEYRIEGRWRNIRLKPDLATGEVLNVGVVVELPDGQIKYKLLEDAKRLACLYGDEVEDPTRFLLSCLRKSLASGNMEPPSPNIVFSDAKPVKGVDDDDVLAVLFDETVTLARQTSKQEEIAFASMDTKKVRKLVFDAIKLKTGTDADRIIGQSETLSTRDGDKTRYLDIPLQGNFALGSVISGWYKSSISVERNLLRADVELSAARRLFNKDKIGLFLLRPGDGQIPQPAMAKLDNLIDTLDWRIRSQGLTLGVREDADALADDIAEWAEL